MQLVFGLGVSLGKKTLSVFQPMFAPPKASLLGHGTPGTRLVARSLRSSRSPRWLSRSRRHLSPSKPPREEDFSGFSEGFLRVFLGFGWLGKAGLRKI